MDARFTWLQMYGRESRVGDSSCEVQQVLITPGY